MCPVSGLFIYMQTKRKLGGLGGSIVFYGKHPVICSQYFKVSPKQAELTGVECVKCFNSLSLKKVTSEERVVPSPWVVRTNGNGRKRQACRPCQGCSSDPGLCINYRVGSEILHNLVYALINLNFSLCALPGHEANPSTHHQKPPLIGLKDALKETMVGWNINLPQDNHVIVSGICDCYPFFSSIFTDVIESKILRWGNPNVSRNAMNAVTRVLVRESWGHVEWM